MDSRLTDEWQSPLSLSEPEADRYRAERLRHQSANTLSVLALDVYDELRLLRASIWGSHPPFDVEDLSSWELIDKAHLELGQLRRQNLFFHAGSAHIIPVMPPRGDPAEMQGEGGHRQAAIYARESMIEHDSDGGSDRPSDIPRHGTLADARIHEGTSTNGEYRGAALSSFHRYAWLVLVLVGLAWGFIAGLSFSLEDFPIAPPIALYVGGALLVVSLTLHQLGRRQ